MQKLKLVTLLEKNLEQKLKANTKQITKFLLSTYLHHIIDTTTIVVHHDTKIWQQIITLDNNQYPVDWFKTHLVAKNFDIFCAIT
jgi:hypothetical protein